MTLVADPLIADAASRWRLGDRVALTLVLGAAIALRVTRIDARPSADELWHLGLSRGAGSPVGVFAPDVAYLDPTPATSLAGAPPAWQIWTHMDGVLHPPLYVLVLRCWRNVFGEGDAVAHALSIACSLLAIAFVFAIARRAMGRCGAIWTALWMAASPVQIYFAQEIRGYAMMIALGAAMLWLATRVEHLGGSPRPGVGAAAIALPLLLTHYFAAGAVAGLSVWGLARLKGRPRVAFLATLAVAALIYLAAWLPFALRQVKSIDTGDAFTSVSAFDLALELSSAAAIPARLLVEGPWLGGSVGIATATIGGVALIAMPWYRSRRLPSLRPWAAWLIGSIALLVALDAARTTSLVSIIRYAAVASPAVPLLAIGLARTFGPRAMHALGAAGVAAMACLHPRNGGVLYDGPIFAGTAAAVAARVGPGDAILVVQDDVSGPHAADLLLLTLAHEPGLFPRPIVKLVTPLSAVTRDRLPDRAWVLSIVRDPPRIARLLPGATPTSRFDVPGEGGVDGYELGAGRAAPEIAR